MRRRVRSLGETRPSPEGVFAPMTRNPIRRQQLAGPRKRVLNLTVLRTYQCNPCSNPCGNPGDNQSVHKNQLCLHWCFAKRLTVDPRASFSHLSSRHAAGPAAARFRLARRQRFQRAPNAPSGTTALPGQTPPVSAGSLVGSRSGLSIRIKRKCANAKDAHVSPGEDTSSMGTPEGRLSMASRVWLRVPKCRNPKDIRTPETS